ncbi:diguanylate cyclase domain-containing protein [Actinomycetes bacterium M1A6_2h]
MTTRKNDFRGFDRRRPPVDPYVSSVTTPMQTRVRLSIAVLVPMFGLAGFFSLLSDDGPASGAPTVIAVLVILTTIPVAFAVSMASKGFSWWDRPEGQERVVGWFVAYADAGVTIVLCTFSSRSAALTGAVLFALVSTYVAHFADRRILVGHVAFTTSMIVLFAVLAVQQGEHDVVSVIPRAIVIFLAVNGTVALTNGSSQALDKSLRNQIVKAHTDPLTGLQNVRGLQYEAAALIERNASHIGFMLVDLDHFKKVNDEHGHRTGDRVLVRTARRLGAFFDDPAVVARRGGEEFVVVLPVEPSKIQAMADAVRVMLCDEGDDVPVTASIGISMLSEMDRRTLTSYDLVTVGMHTADIAMYRAKSNGRNRVEQFTG